MMGAKRAFVLLLAVLAIALLIVPEANDGPLKSMGQTLVSIASHPLRALDAVTQGVDSVWSRYVALRSVSDENRVLRREIATLQEEATGLHEMAAASERLSALLNLKEEVGYTTVAARVIARDPTNWYHSIVINKGQDDGISVEMGVMTPSGAVGRVVKVQRQLAVVLLIIDRNNAITGLVQRTRDEGIVEGTEKGWAWIKYLPLLSNVKVGDIVVTSGMAGGFPRGLPIGRITRIERREAELFLSAEIQPDTDFGRLEEVLVITSPREPANLPALAAPNAPSPVKRTERIR